MSVMATRVHFAVVFRAMAEAVEFLNRQRVHVCPQANRTRAIAAFQYADHTGLAQTTMGLNAPRFQAAGNEISRCSLFVTQFRMGMNRSSKALDFAVSGLYFGNQFHDGVMWRWYFNLHGIAWAHIGPGAVII